MFTLVAFQKSDLLHKFLISPVGENIGVMDLVRPKLAQKPNTFTLNKPLTLTQEAVASSNQDYDLAKAYVVVDFETGKIIKSKNLTEKMPMASLTKVMTAVTALDLVPTTQTFIVDENSANQIPTKLVLTPGEKITLDEALNAAILTSANDMTQLINNGVNNFYNSEIFIPAMNEKAKIIGMKNSSFTNPQGFDNPKHYSTVEDLAILTNYALTKYPILEEISKKPMDLLPQTQNHKEFHLNNWQGLINVYPGTSGLKIGNTGRAKHTTIVVSERNNHKVIAILLGAPGVLERDLWTAQLLDDAFEAEFGLEPVNITELDLRAKYATWKYFN